MLSLLDIPHEIIEVDLRIGAHKTPSFIKMHPFGQVPVLDDNGTIIWDSLAIIVYLAKKYDQNRTWLPTDPLGAAHVQQWLTVAAGLLVNGPGAARLHKIFGKELDHAETLKLAANLLEVIESRLKPTTFLTGATPTLADVAAYSYIAHSPEGDVDLSPYPAIQSWLKTVEALPNFVGMQRTEG